MFVEIVTGLKLTRWAMQYATKRLQEYNRERRKVELDYQMAQHNLSYSAPKGLMWEQDEIQQLQECPCGCRDAVIAASVRAEVLRGDRQ